MEKQKMGTEILGIVFFISWLVCGCSVEKFFDGGAPVAVLAVLVAIGSAMILGGKWND